MSTWVLRVVSTLPAGAVTVFAPADAPEMWVMAYDPDAEGGRGYVETINDRRRARRFDTVNAALDFWRQPSTVQPLRPDGKPNRPLTSWSIMLEREDEPPAPAAGEQFDPTGEETLTELRELIADVAEGRRGERPT
jgi:hypothetical protein